MSDCIVRATDKVEDRIETKGLGVRGREGRNRVRKMLVKERFEGRRDRSEAKEGQ